MYDTSGEESDTLCKQAIFGVRIHVLTVLYLAEFPCLSVHMTRWVFYPYPSLCSRKYTLQISKYSAEFHQI